MGAAASIEQADWTEEEVVQILLPHYMKQPEKCLRVHNALVQLVMLEKDRMLSAKYQQQAGLVGESARSHQEQHRELERQKQLLAKKEQLEQEIIEKRKNILNKEQERADFRGIQRFSSDIAGVINMVRTEPTRLIPYAHEHLSTFKDDYSFRDPLNRPNTTISTKEGRKAVVECIQFLQMVSPTVPIVPNRCLENAACDFAQMLASAIKTPVISIGDHINKHGNWRGAIGQSVSYGNIDAIAIVLSLLIDDGSLHRGHRQSIFDPKFLQLGAALTKHNNDGYCCVIEYATSVLDWSTQQREHVVVSFSRSARSQGHDEELFRKVLFSIPNDTINQEVEGLLNQQGNIY